jgi:hypothetical protein
MLRRTLLLALAFTALALALGSCSKEHEELLNAFPLPMITSAQRVDAESVQLEWSVEDAATVEEYRLYVGLYANLGFTELDVDSLYTATTATSFLYEDPGLAYVDDELCAEAGLCDTLYTYAFFRVSAVRDGVEGVPGPRAFITP